MDVRRHLPSVLVTVGALVAVVGSFRPWLASGTAERSSYDLLGVVDRLGWSGAGSPWWLVVSWPAMPLVLAVATAATWWRRRVPMFAAGTVGVAYIAAVAGAVLVAPGDGFVRVLPGPAITLAGGLLVAVGLMVEAVSSARRRASMSSLSTQSSADRRSASVTRGR